MTADEINQAAVLDIYDKLNEIVEINNTRLAEVSGQPITTETEKQVVIIAQIMLYVSTAKEAASQIKAQFEAAAAAAKQAADMQEFEAWKAAQGK